MHKTLDLRGRFRSRPTLGKLIAIETAGPWRRPDPRGIQYALPSSRRDHNYRCRVIVARMGRVRSSATSMYKPLRNAERRRRPSAGRGISRVVHGILRSMRRTSGFGADDSSSAAIAAHPS